MSIDTCDTNWQSTRDSLIITAFIFSLLSTLIIIAAGILLAIGYFYFKQGVCIIIAIAMYWFTLKVLQTSNML